MYVKPFVKTYHFKIQDYSNCAILQTKFLTTSAHRNRIHQDESGSDDDINSEYDYLNTTIDKGYARDLLQTNPKDILLQRIYSSVSIQELFNILKNNKNHYSCNHLTQTVLVLYDLQRIYSEVTQETKSSTESPKEFFNKLQENNSFHMLLRLINDKLDNFDTVTLSYSLLYLNKLGLDIQTPLLQLLCDRLKRRLLKNFCVSSASRFLETVFSEVNLQSYFMSQELIPLVLNEIDACESTETLEDLSVSLNKLHNVVTDENLDNYKRKVERFIKTGLLTSNDYKIMLQIIAFLNYPKWREKNSVLISKCILLIKDNLSNLKVNEIIGLYEVFFKIQEPGEVLSDLQRCSSRYFHKLEDIVTAQKITLFSTIIYFASPTLRSEFQTILKQYVKECNDYDNLILLRRLLSYVKISDMKLCELYWDKVLKCLKTNSEGIDVIKLSQNYINFNIDIDNYRHSELENEILKLLNNMAKEVTYNFFPQKLSSTLSFVLLYGNDKTFLDDLVAKLETNWEQFRHRDCLKLSFTLKIFNQTDKKYMKLLYAQRIDKVLNKVISKEVTCNDYDLWKNNALLKSCVYKSNASDLTLMTKLLNNYKNFNYIASKNIETIYYCFLITNTLIPEVIDNMIKYIVTYKDHVLGFNVARVLYLCYCLGYHPKNSLDFFETCVNTIIRDQERMTGLSLIYCALALCFFNNLPNSLIKSIFNEHFMDKIDHELQNCYSKDKYPLKVRNNLMQLNRAVCLDYPECNIPWFHQKYIDENIKAKNKKSTVFANKVKEYLARIVQNKDALAENVITPYGYEVDFVINLNNQSEIAVDSSECTQRIAILLVPDFSYTRITPQLKGNVQLKKRHLEMLGYKIIIIKFSEWIGLFYADERIDFLKSVIWPKK